jgi:hypothetical protein
VNDNRTVAASLMADLVSSSRMATALLLAGVLQIALVSLGAPGWPCPFQEALGLPCPGCGLSRASVALLHGDLRSALLIHPFVVLVPAFLILVGAGALLPPPLRERVAAGLRRLEARVPLGLIAVIAFITFGLMRLAVLAGPQVERSLH